MRFRTKRIAWSVMWGFAALLLIVLCVRSYYREDCIQGFRDSKYERVEIKSIWGRLRFVVSSMSHARHYPESNWEFHSNALDESGDADAWKPPWKIEGEKTSAAIGFRRYYVANQFNVFAVPYWFPIVSCVCLALAPWLRSRFTLRALLIATTLIAVVLGLAVWLSG